MDKKRGVFFKNCFELLNWPTIGKNNLTAAPRAVTSWKRRLQTRKGNLSSTQATWKSILEFTWILLQCCKYSTSHHSKKDAAKASYEDANYEERSCSSPMDVRRRHRGHLGQKNQDGRRLGLQCRAILPALWQRSLCPWRLLSPKSWEKRNDSRLKLICLNLPLSNNNLDAMTRPEPT